MMTPEQIAAMVADREAGTPGPWYIYANETVRMDMPRIVRYGEAGLSICKTHLVGGCDPDPARANAGRIARVPEMESAIIEQAAEIARLRDALRVIWTKDTLPTPSFGGVTGGQYVHVRRAGPFAQIAFAALAGAQ